MALENLSNKISAHRKVTSKVNDLFDELEKPWAIKIRNELVLYGLMMLIRNFGATE